MLLDAAGVGVEDDGFGDGLAVGDLGGVVVLVAPAAGTTAPPVLGGGNVVADGEGLCVTSGVGVLFACAAGCVT